jgi:hypothetical protein
MIVSLPDWPWGVRSYVFFDVEGKVLWPEAAALIAAYCR